MTVSKEPGAVSSRPAGRMRCVSRLVGSGAALVLICGSASCAVVLWPPERHPYYTRQMETPCLVTPPVPSRPRAPDVVGLRVFVDDGSKDGPRARYELRIDDEGRLVLVPIRDEGPK